MQLGDTVTSGSSLMPQKKNPDACELMRGKCGRVFGHLQALLVTMKGLPLAYNKDMQEDKEPVFDAAETLDLALTAMGGMVSDLTPNPDAMGREAARGFSTATDLADWLVREAGVPFRDAHHITGTLVKMAEDKGCDLADLSLADMQGVNKSITDDVFNVLTVDASVRSRISYGGTAPANVRAQAKAARQRLEEGQ